MPIWKTHVRNLFLRLRGLPLGPPGPPFNHARNPWKAKHPWPPDVMKFSYSKQMHMERKYKRRRAKKWLTDSWMKWTGVARIVIPIGVAVYILLFLDFESDPMSQDFGYVPFVEFRKWFWGKLDWLWTPVSYKTSISKEQQQATATADADASLLSNPRDVPADLDQHRRDQKTLPPPTPPQK